MKHFGNKWKKRGLPVETHKNQQVSGKHFHFDETTLFTGKLFHLQIGFILVNSYLWIAAKYKTIKNAHMWVMTTIWFWSFTCVGWLACSTNVGNTWTTPMKPAHHSQKHGKDCPHLICRSAAVSAGSVPRARLLSSPGVNGVVLQENLLARPRRLLSLPKI